MGVSTAQTRDQIRNYLFETLIPIPSNAWPSDDADLFENGLDSLRLMQLLTFIEQEVGISLPDEEVTPDRIGSVRAIVDWISRHRA